MNLDPYITFQSKGLFFILKTDTPHYVGQILRFENDQEMAFYDLSKHIYSTQVPGYRIGIAFAGALQGNQVLLHPQWREEIRAIFESMAQFYITNRILPHPDKYKKYYI